MLAHYLLLSMNRNKVFVYVDTFRLPNKQPTNDVDVLLAAISISQGWIKPGTIALSTNNNNNSNNNDGDATTANGGCVTTMTMMERQRASALFLRLYRGGKLGLFCLDDIPLTTTNTNNNYNNYNNDKNNNNKNSASTKNKQQ